MRRPDGSCPLCQQKIGGFEKRVKSPDEVDQILRVLRKEQKIADEKIKNKAPPSERELRNFKLEEVFHVGFKFYFYIQIYLAF